MSEFRPVGGIEIPAIASGVNRFASAASISGTLKTQGAAPVTATRTASFVRATNTPAIAYRDAGFGNFLYEAFVGIGKETSVMISPSPSAVENMPVKNVSDGMLRLLVRMVAPNPSTAAG